MPAKAAARTPGAVSAGPVRQATHQFAPANRSPSRQTARSDGVDGRRWVVDQDMHMAPEQFGQRGGVPRLSDMHHIYVGHS